LDPDQLIQQVVDLIRERFGLYYVGLFLVDEAQEYAVLRAGTGAAGKAMLERNHRIRVGAGMIGWCVANQRPRIALRAEMDDARLKNPDLPDTRSEAAIPLRSRGRVIGALTVQSEKADAFDEATIVVFETMADQVAVAMDNARLFRESQQALESLNRAYGQITREEWSRLLQTRGDIGFSSFANGEIAVETAWQPELEQAVTRGQTVEESVSDGKYAAAIGVPIKVRDTVIGVIGGYKSGPVTEWSEAEKIFLQEVADVLSVALESARSYQQIQLSALREQLVGEVTAAMRESLDIDQVLQIAAREMRQALDLAEVEIRLRSANDKEEENVK
jgi:GAF domain-containing protein